ncbi:hypothetical protein QU617_09350 [Pseudomonas guariconensis]|uniref:hypothetical protein n=1 Tax=Pseudomonas guariconensis TaxID=1288410 RepID=UPI0025AA039D|nr:hypothetical protein [Pseudomonas guariconensis]MDM9593527.1 hypothetical protein [Pseudomonas guariconensis]MDM9606354.1 hypothetical protein [Pseudomonas guariconensis]MDM9611311.1 hypothetical protein [Pseudomonas guariconensis]
MNPLLLGHQPLLPGAVTDLFEWVQGLPQEFEMLAAHMCALAEACDLDAVSALLEAVPATKP